MNLFEKILSNHGIDPIPEPGTPIRLPIDQTLTQDATGTMACLQFEALGIDKVKADLSVSYVDHNTLQSGFYNFDDHRFLRTIAAKYGMVFSEPGNGICHQLNLERFGVPGRTLLGSDSHTPTGGGIGMVAIGAGGLDVAMAMAGEPFTLPMPEVVSVHLTGQLPPWVAAKDVILEVLRRETVKGGVGKVYEYTGPGVAALSVTERATITNMGAELGATTSLFPSDDNTLAFLKTQGREDAWTRLEPDADAKYSRVIDIDLAKLVPLAACPHMPDLVKEVRELEGAKVDQVVIGSCTNSSYKDLATVAAMVKGKRIPPELSLVISPGSRQVLTMLADSGELTDLIKAGARIMECACGPCIGMGQAPPSGGVTVRTMNRNFLGRCGTKDAGAYLVSPETAAATALAGKFADPRDLGEAPQISLPETYPTLEAGIVYPPEDGSGVEILRGPNIKPLPLGKAVGREVSGEVLLKLPDNITTDDIMPAGTHILSFRSNIPKISKYVFSLVDEGFSARAKEKQGGFIVAGENYGQGSSREHAALAPMHLGIRGVIAASFARIHRANLINFGILPLIFADPKALDDVSQGDVLILENALENILEKDSFDLKNITTGKTIPVRIDLNPFERQVLSAGGKLNWYRAQQN
ncbi:aconitase [Desulfatibacillum alkenivorans DSM 16219]|jgi:aconitate hydratase|uniref:Aconitate hydratase A n=1 Tax=Desulfatibacillum alkenivorans DSM 16219 TaxID=1121393 RepID=A0A1M7AXD5_9BACT|nr:aconitate hydratase [Desulfatibacillum alkenivorans]SHL47384.1 aconitase [Desulfatibacillum alkenivorans DSM 16219]